MEWIERSGLSNINTVEDLYDLLQVIDNPNYTEFQYLVNGDDWVVSIK